MPSVSRLPCEFGVDSLISGGCLLSAFFVTSKMVEQHLALRCRNGEYPCSPRAGCASLVMV